jgi:hypothetical protein
MERVWNQVQRGHRGIVCSERSERRERSEFRGVGHGCEHRSGVGAPRAPAADLSPDGGSAQAALLRRPEK